MTTETIYIHSLYIYIYYTAHDVTDYTHNIANRIEPKTRIDSYANNVQVRLNIINIFCSIVYGED